MARLPLLSIVEDDESHLLSLTNLIRSLGFRVEGFSSAEAFLNSPERDDADCVIIDVRMPGMGGLGLAHELIGSERSVPFIFISAHADPNTHEAASKLGAIAFLTKPCREADLVAAITKALNPTD
jgi:FixJ family two-component response regulator